MTKNMKEIKELVRISATGKIPANFTIDDEPVTVSEVRDSIRAAIKEFAYDFNSMRRNKLDIFELMQEYLDLASPARVINKLPFAEIKQFSNGQKPTFVLKVGKNRAKAFITKAAASGVYETFRLDKTTMDVTTDCIGGAFQIDFERYQAGEEDFADYNDALMEGIEDAIYVEIQKAIRSTLTNVKRPSANRYAGSSFDAAKMQGLVTIAKTYGTGAVIYATPEFIAAMGADAIVTPTAAVAGVYSTKDIADISNTGYITSFRGTTIIPIEQSFTDETNAHVAIDPQMAYIFPTGGEKVVKVAFEGGTIVTDVTNRDNSMEVQAYKKFGVAVLSFHNWCIYQNTGITSTYQGPTITVS